MLKRSHRLLKFWQWDLPAREVRTYQAERIRVISIYQWQERGANCPLDVHEASKAHISTSLLCQAIGKELLSQQSVVAEER